MLRYNALVMNTPGAAALGAASGLKPAAAPTSPNP